MNTLKYVNDLVAKYVPKLKDNPWIMGYYYGFGSWDREIGWINTTIERIGSPGRARLLGLLEDRYKGDIDSLNKVYGTQFRSFGELKQSGSLVYPEWIRRLKMSIAQMPDETGSQEMFDDAQVLLGEIIEQVYRLGHEAIRKYDQNHMIFGAYVKEATLNMDMWRRVDPYIDVIAPQHVSKVFPIRQVVERLSINRRSSATSRSETCTRRTSSERVGRPARFLTIWTGSFFTISYPIEFLRIRII